MSTRHVPANAVGTLASARANGKSHCTSLMMNCVFPFVVRVRFDTEVNQ